LLIPQATTANHSVNSVASAASAGINTFSVYAKAGGYNYLQMLWGSGTDYANFNLTGAGSVSQNSGASPTITAVGNGWYRCTITSTLAGPSTVYLQPVPVGTETRYATYLGDAVSGVYAWGAQLEAAAFASSYIPTVASQVTRAVDLASVDTMSPWFNERLGTLYAEFDVVGYDTTLFPCIVQLGIRSIGSRGALHVVNGSSATTSFNIFDGAGNYQGVNTPVAYTLGAIRKMAGAYATNDSASSIDASTPTTDTSVTLATGLNVLAIGNYALFGSNNGASQHIRRIAYYPRRMNNADLQTLTTL
jgi:hypothetical protein